jgi:hypothetical protein
MEYDRDKVDEMVLALLWLTLAGEHRAWKGHSRKPPLNPCESA